MRARPNIKAAPRRITPELVGRVLDYLERASGPPKIEQYPFKQHRTVAEIDAAEASTPPSSADNLPAEAPAPGRDCPSHPAQATKSSDWLTRRRETFTAAEDFLKGQVLSVRVFDRQHPIRRYLVGSIHQPLMLEEVVELAIQRGLVI